MKRTLIAAVWVAGSTIPVALAAVFVFGCCVLPFHGALHRALPLCHMAVEILHGGHASDDDDHHPVQPAPEKERVGAPNLLTTLTTRQSIARSDAFAVSQPRLSPVAHRSFISLGAVRCDTDIGRMRLLVETFRI
jgi:hypothetical protein